MGYVYSDRFFDYINIGARRSAGVVVPLLAKTLPVRSVLDVGCGEGVWLAAWRERGVVDIRGVDGDYVARERLLVDAAAFDAVDIAAGFALGRRFDLVQCLEVGEHLPQAASDRLVACLVDHGDVVLFSAAVPGQGGENHVNEQPLEHWRVRFATHGYAAVDLVRPAIQRKSSVEPWYRYNALVYVKRSRLAGLGRIVEVAAVPDGVPLADYASASWKLRRRVLAPLPSGVVTALARAHGWLQSRLAA